MTDVLRILIGPLAWLGWFSAIYGLHGIACSFEWGRVDVWGLSLLRLVLTAAWIAAILVQFVILAGLYSRRFGSPSVFIRRVSRITGWVGLVSTIWSLFPVVATSSCW
jgi:hypothetical protein